MKFTHINEKGRAKIVDVSEENDTACEAIAVGSIYTKREAIDIY